MILGEFFKTIEDANMQRRHFLKCMSALGTASAPFPTLAGTQMKPVNIKQAFNLALAKQPSLGSNVENDFAPTLMKVEGASLSQTFGYLVRNVLPAQRGENRYGHWFEGDGMVQQFTFSKAGYKIYGTVYQDTEIYRRRKCRMFSLFGPRYYVH